jgi:hypothetical protein
VATFASQNTVDATLTVDGVVVLNERYSPANGLITVRGLRSVLEAAIYGQMTEGTQDTASAAVVFAAVYGSTTVYTASRTLYAARLKNPRDPHGTRATLAAGDLVAVAGSSGLIAPELYSSISGGGVTTTEVTSVPTDGSNLGDDVRVWVERTTCPDRGVCVRFLNRYDVPQTMMTPLPLDIKPAFQDQTQLYLGQRVRYSVESQTEYIMRSGRIHRFEEYASWDDLITSRKAEVWYGGQWLPIIVTKSNFTAQRRSAGMPCVEITFRMADPRQAL